MGYRLVRKKSLLGLPWFTLRSELDIFNKLKLSCVYAVGPEHDMRPIKVGWTSSPTQRFTDLQAGNHKTIKIFDIAWLPGPPLAKRLEKEIHALLENSVRRLSGDWFDAEPKDVLPAFDQALGILRIPSLTHDAMIDQITRENERRTQSLVEAARAA